jgi:hypothetical protein
VKAVGVASALSLAWVLAAADPSAAVLISRRTSIPPKEAQELAQQLSSRLVSAGVPLKLDADQARSQLSRLGLSDSAQCAGKRGCVIELGRQLGVSHVIAVSISQIGSDRSIAVELLEVEKGDVLEKDAVIVGLGAALEADAVAAFGSKTRARLAPAVVEAPKVEVPPEPKPEPKLVPKEPPPPAVVVEPGPPPKSHTPQLVLGAGAAVAAVAAVVLLASGFSARSDANRTTTAPDGSLRSAYSGSEALSRLHSSDTQLGIAGGAGAIAVGLGAAVVITW